MGSTYYAYMTLLWPEFITEEMAGLNFCVCCALSIGEVKELNKKISEKVTI